MNFPTRKMVSRLEVVGIAGMVSITAMIIAQSQEAAFILLLLILILSVIGTAVLTSLIWSIPFSIFALILTVYSRDHDLPVSGVWLWDALVFGVVFIGIVFASEFYRKQRSDLSLNRDPLTHTYIRSFYLSLCEMEIIRSRRYKRSFTTVLIRLDQFKKLNRLIGHRKADELLILTAKVIRENIRTTDSLARIGDHEYGLLLPETNEKGFLPVIEKIRKVLTELGESFEKSWEISFSIGSVTFDEAPVNLDALLTRMSLTESQMEKNGVNTTVYETYKDPLNVEVI